MAVQEKIRWLRQLKGWSQEEVAHRLGMSPNGYGSIERGGTDVSLSRLEQLAGLFGVKLTDLFEANEKIIFNLAGENNNQNNWHIGNGSAEHLQLKTELEKQQLLTEHKTQENASLQQEIAYLKEIIALLKTDNQ